MIDPPVVSNNGHLNGNSAAPPPASGGALHSARGSSAPRSPQTVFPPDLAEINPRSLLYWLGWAEMGGQRLRRWLSVALVVLCAGLALLRAPGWQWIAYVCVLAVALVYLLPLFYRRTNYAHFQAEPDASLGEAGAERLPPSQKIEVHVSGTLSVAGKRRDFLWLPGFYRTFATREHALLCICRDRRILGIGAPPEADMGLWYAFWNGEQIVEMLPGKVGAGGRMSPGIRLTYLPTGKQGRFGAPPAPDVLYIACANEADRACIWGDLQVEASTPITPVQGVRETSTAAPH